MTDTATPFSSAEIYASLFPTASPQTIAASRTPQTLPAFQPHHLAGSGARGVRVAIYARVSTDSDSQESSLEGQQTHYLSEIASHPDWTLAGAYIESDVSGTTTAGRSELERLIDDCRAGLIDLILTKSVSRFARNAADLLTMVRELTELGVVIRFDKENISTDRMESELMLTIYAAFAQDESRSISSNVRMGIRHRFQTGTYISTKPPYGYTIAPASPVSTSVSTPQAGPVSTSVCSSVPASKKQYIIDPTESLVIRRIFDCVMNGMGSTSIAALLNAEGVPCWTESRKADVPTQQKRSKRRKTREDVTASPGLWTSNHILSIVQNPFYKGDTLYQKTFMDENYVQKANRGQRDQYLHQNSHPAIIERSVWDAANSLIARRAGARGAGNVRYCFSGKVKCACCGGTLRRSCSGTRPTYRCAACKLNVFQADLENMFATCLNKLYFAEMSDLPILRLAEPDLVAEQDVLIGQLAQNEQQSALCDADRTQLESEHKMLMRRWERLKASDIEEFRKKILERGIHNTFTAEDGALFTEYIDEAVVSDGPTVEFQFVCGLRLEESPVEPL